MPLESPGSDVSRKSIGKRGHSWPKLGSAAELESKSSSFPNHSFHIVRISSFVHAIRMSDKVHFESLVCTVGDCVLNYSTNPDSAAIVQLMKGSKNKRRQRKNIW